MQTFFCFLISLPVTPDLLAEAMAGTGRELASAGTGEASPPPQSSSPGRVVAGTATARDGGGWGFSHHCRIRSTAEEEEEEGEGGREGERTDFFSLFKFESRNNIHVLHTKFTVEVKECKGL